jgi:FKBP-type peptidyl-prolyl cis-trans isomerase FklB
MMKKINWILLLCLGLLMSLQAHTQQADADAQAQANAANKARVLKGGKLSPKEKAELAKAAIADTNQQAGENFLAANRTKPGVVSLPSGVQYRILTAGAGKKPTDESSVRCRYIGTLTDGSSFDKVEDKKPGAIRISGLLPGLKEAVKLMPVGSKWEVVVPPQLAYGAHSNRHVGPNAVLIYVIEIVSIV